jgi:plastocyanin
MRIPTSLALAVAAFTLAACGSSTTETSQDCGSSGAAANVTATSSQTFASSSVTINAGQSVCWKNTGNLDHTVTSNTAGMFDQALNQGQIFVHVFPTAGTYPYHCRIHAGMTGTVIVQ